MNDVIAIRPALEVGDVIRSHGEAFLQKYGGVLSSIQKKTLRDLAACRTAALGGHMMRCLDCGQERLAYNSCRNRHCPKCQAMTRAAWLEREAKHLLPVEYFHVVFTLPEEVADLATWNAALVYGLLFESASATLREVSANPKRLGAQVGVLAILHTWGQNLHHHPHVHCVVTGGGLSCNERGEADANPRWVSCRPGFFLPVRVLSRLFRGKFLAGLHTLFIQGKLRFGGRLTELNAPAAFAAWLDSLRLKEWVVYAKRPFGGPTQVLKYLARYTHRVAISNHRLVDLSDGKVTFRYKDYASHHEQKLLTLSASEFLRRFVQHVLPRGFVKIRHYGLLANRYREERLLTARKLLLLVLVLAAATAGTEEPAVRVDPVKPPCCPHCGSTRWLRCELPEEPGAFGGSSRNTS
jgi:hypothetical protein